MQKVVVVVAVILASCGNKASPPALRHDVAVKPSTAPEGLDLRLSNGKQSAPASVHANLAPAAKLGDAEVQALLARARPIETAATDAQTFVLRPSSQPPPRTGETVAQSFPPAAMSTAPKPAVPGAALEVVRYMPEGPVAIAPEVNVTFSQPMVAITSQADAAAVQPVKLSPQPKGSWRWIGTRTITFKPDVRFPQATTYRVEIAAGTKSAIGGVLAKPVAFTFETPAPQIVAFSPNTPEQTIYGFEPQRVDVPMFALFDQRVDPAAALAHVVVHARGGKPLAVRPLDDNERAADKTIARLAGDATRDGHDGRWIAFRTAQPLPSDAVIEIELSPGMPSLEGPNVTTAGQTFELHTDPPLKLIDARCGGECRPSTPFSFQLNNPLDDAKFDDALITVSPAIPELEIRHSGPWITVIGQTKPRETYHVAIAGKLTDTFGQQLGHDEHADFAVLDAAPSFYGPSGMVVLDPAAPKPTLDFFTTNYDQLEVELYRVAPGDLTAYDTYERTDGKVPPGKLVTREVVPTKAGKNALAETSLDLSPALDHGHGHVLAIVSPRPWTETFPPPRLIAWVQVTKLAIDAHVDNENLVAFATDLATGKPAGDVALDLEPFGVEGKTGADGLATLALSDVGAKGATQLIARRGDDVAFVAGSSGYWDYETRWRKSWKSLALAWYVVLTIVKLLQARRGRHAQWGWLRTVDQNMHGDVGPIGTAATSVTYRVVDSRSNEIAKGSATVDALGGFSTKLTLPKTPNLGTAWVEFTSVGSIVATHRHAIRIDEFRRPEFEVAAHASEGPFVVGGGGDVTIAASYFAGGPLAGAPTTWHVHATPTTFTPPNRDDYTFGTWTPWWQDFGACDDCDAQPDDDAPMPSRDRSPSSWTFEAKTDGGGEHVLHMDFLSLAPAVPMSVTASGTVMDVNRQAWNASSTITVHPATYYVGLKAKQPFVDKGQPFELDVIGVDLDGNQVAGANIAVHAVRESWEYKHGRFVAKQLDPEDCDPKACKLATPAGGEYKVTATITDPQGRTNTSTYQFWVTGGEQPPARDVTREQVRLVPDKKAYRDGDTARLLVQAPFAPAEGVVTWRRSGIVKTERITLASTTATIAVPISDAMVPNIYVHVDLVGTAPRLGADGKPDAKLPRRPAYASGELDLAVPPKLRTLAVSVAPSAAKVAPGDAASIAVTVHDAAGKPIEGAQVAVIVVDESVLTAAAATFQDPVESFYRHRDSATQDVYSRSQVRLANPERTKIAARRAPGDESGGTGTAMALVEGKMGKRDDDRAEGQYKMQKSAEDPQLAREQAIEQARSSGILGSLELTTGNAAPAIAVRSNFDALAAFAPAATTGADGIAKVDVKMPDSVTRYRIVALAAAGDKQFGKGESTITARLPLMVRPSAPRFLSYGDVFRLPIVVQNQTDVPLMVKLAIRATNATLTDGAGRVVMVPANDRVEVQVPAAAALAGTARFQIIGAAGAASDAAEVVLPVETPATTEAFASYGVIDHGATIQPIALPGRVIPQFGGLEITTASTNLQALTDALLYLVRYPFECSEQRSSRIVAIAALRDVLTAFHTKDMPAPAQLEASVAQDIGWIAKIQNRDGGFAYWERNDDSVPYVSIFVANAFARARAKGFDVPAAVIEHSLAYLRDIEHELPPDYADYPDVVHALSAYALYTRKLLGDVDVAKAKALFAQVGGAAKLPLEADGWLLGVLAKSPQAASERAAIMRYALDHVSETAGAASFAMDYSDGAHLILASDRRIDGVMLESLIQEAPASDLIPKLVTGLLAHRTRGRWRSTQENSFALLALDLYFHTYEKTKPDFVARVWLGDAYAGDHAFRGRTTESSEIDVAMTDVAAHDKQALAIEKDGSGRLYYRIGMTYAPQDLVLAPVDHGFVVERKYEGVDNPRDVTRDNAGAWHVKAGARVRVALTMVNESRRYQIALVDPLPAGFEPMNPELATTGPIPQDKHAREQRGRYWWWDGPWYEHQNMRDDRVEAFASLLWEGVHAYDYVARATTPASFVVAPPKAEEMYMPETFGRGASDRVIVE